MQPRCKPIDVSKSGASAHKGDVIAIKWGKSRARVGEQHERASDPGGPATCHALSLLLHGVPCQLLRSGSQLLRSGSQGAELAGRA